MSSVNLELEHRLTKLELLQSNIESYVQDDRSFHEKLESKLDDISVKIEGLRFYEKTIEKMEKQVIEHEKKLDKLYTYFKIMAALFFLASGGSVASLFKFFVP